MIGNINSSLICVYCLQQWDFMALSSAVWQRYEIHLSDPLMQSTLNHSLFVDYYIVGKGCFMLFTFNLECRHFVLELKHYTHYAPKHCVYMHDACYATFIWRYSCQHICSFILWNFGSWLVLIYFVEFWFAACVMGHFVPHFLVNKS